MNGLDFSWSALGIVSGVLHGAALWWSTRAGPARALALGAVRLAIPTAILVGAALSHRIVPAAAGWAGGFAAVALLRVGRRE